MKFPLFQYGIKFSKLFNKDKKRSKSIEKSIEKWIFFLKKVSNRCLFMRGAHEHVNKACRFEKIGIKRGKILLLLSFSY